MQSSREKFDLSPTQMLDIALQHAEACRHLLTMPAKSAEHFDPLLPATSLIYTALELTFKAYLLCDRHRLRPAKGLAALYEQMEWLELSRQEEDLLKQLGQQQAFRKAQDYALWDNAQQLQVFVHQMLELHANILSQMPLELHPDYRD